MFLPLPLVGFRKIRFPNYVAEQLDRPPERIWARAMAHEGK